MDHPSFPGPRRQPMGIQRAQTVLSSRPASSRTSKADAQAAYSRTATAGIVFVSAEATTWASADAAKTATAERMAYTVQTQQWGIEIALGQTIGDESYGIQYGAKTSGDQTAFAVVFRAANVTNDVFIRGVTRTIEVSMAIELAKKQLARLRV